MLQSRWASQACCCLSLGSSRRVHLQLDFYLYSNASLKASQLQLWVVCKLNSFISSQSYYCYAFFQEERPELEVVYSGRCSVVLTKTILFDADRVYACSPRLIDALAERLAFFTWLLHSHFSSCARTLCLSLLEVFLLLLSQELTSGLKICGPTVQLLASLSSFFTVNEWSYLLQEYRPYCCSICWQCARTLSVELRLLLFR